MDLKKVSKIYQKKSTDEGLRDFGVAPVPQNVHVKNNVTVEPAKVEIPQTLELKIPGIDQIKGERGEDGYTPKKGVDYFTQEEVESVEKSIKSVLLNIVDTAMASVVQKANSLRDGIDGHTPQKGIDYFTDQELRLIQEEIKSILQKNLEKYVDKKVKESTPKELQPKDIVEKLESIKKEKDKLHAWAIQGLDKYIKYTFVGGGGSSNFLDLTDTPNSYLGQVGKGLRVNGSGTGLEFYTPGDIGDITEVVAGTGLSGGGSTGSVTLTLDTTYTDSLYEPIGSVATHESTYDHSLLHTRQHGLDSASDHTGISGSQDNFMSISGTGLPEDSGYNGGSFLPFDALDIPVNRIVYGTGAGVSHEAAFTYNASTNQLGLTGNLAITANQQVVQDVAAASSSNLELKFFNSNTNRYTAFSFGESYGVSQSNLYYFNGTYSTSGRYIANSMLIEKFGTGQLNFAYPASGSMNIYDTNNTLRWTLSSTGHITHINTTAGGGIETGATFVGNWVNSTNYAIFTHRDLKAAPTSYGVLQQNNGALLLNSATGTSLYLRYANNDRVVVGPSGIYTHTVPLYVQAGAHFGYSNSSVDHADTIGGMWIPRTPDISNLVFLDHLDDAYFWDKRYTSITYSTAPTSGLSESMFRNNSSYVEWATGSSPFPLTIEIDSSTNPIYANGNGYFQLGITFRFLGTVNLTNIQVENWDGSAYQTVYNGAPGNALSSGVFLTSRFLAAVGLSYAITKLRITFSGTNPLPAGGNLRIQRLMVYHDTAPWDPWHLDIGGGTMYGDVLWKGTDADATPISIGTNGTWSIGTYKEYAWRIGNAGTEVGAIRLEQSASGDYDMHFLTSTTGSGGYAIGATLGHSGNFGVGTNNPAAKLHVEGTQFLIKNGTGLAYITMAGRSSDGRAEFAFQNNGLSVNNARFVAYMNELGIESGGAETMRLNSTQDVGIGISSSILGKTHIDQASTTGAKPVLVLDQADVSEEFVRFIGSSVASDITASVVVDSDVASATTQGYVKVYVRDDGNNLTDQFYYIPIFTLSA